MGERSWAEGGERYGLRREGDKPDVGVGMKPAGTASATGSPLRRLCWEHSAGVGSMAAALKFSRTRVSPPSATCTASASMPPAARAALECTSEFGAVLAERSQNTKGKARIIGIVMSTAE